MSNCCGSGNNYYPLPEPDPNNNEMVCLGENQDWEAMAEHGIVIISVGLRASRITGVLVKLPNEVPTA